MSVKWSPAMASALELYGYTATMEEAYERTDLPSPSLLAVRAATTPLLEMAASGNLHPRVPALTFATLVLEFFFVETISALKVQGRRTEAEAVQRSTRVGFLHYSAILEAAVGGGCSVDEMERMTNLFGLTLQWHSERINKIMLEEESQQVRTIMEQTVKELMDNTTVDDLAVWEEALDDINLDGF